MAMASSHLTLDQTIRWEGKMREKIKRKERDEEGKEKLHLFSSFSGDRTFGFHRSKKQSSS